MPAVTCMMRALPLSICTAAKCVADAHCHFANISSVRPAQEQPTSLASYIQNQLLYMQGEGRHSSKVQHWQCLPGTRTGHRCPSSAALNVRGPPEKTGQLTPQRNGTSGHGSGAKTHSLMLRHGKGKALRRSWHVHMKRETKRGRAAKQRAARNQTSAFMVMQRCVSPGIKSYQNRGWVEQLQGCGLACAEHAWRLMQLLRRMLTKDRCQCFGCCCAKSCCVAGWPTDDEWHSVPYCHAWGWPMAVGGGP